MNDCSFKERAELLKYIMENTPMFGFTTVVTKAIDHLFPQSNEKANQRPHQHRLRSE